MGGHRAVRLPWRVPEHLWRVWARGGRGARARDEGRRAPLLWYCREEDYRGNGTRLPQSQVVLVHLQCVFRPCRLEAVLEAEMAYTPANPSCHAKFDELKLRLKGCLKLIRSGVDMIWSCPMSLNMLTA